MTLGLKRRIPYSAGSVLLIFCSVLHKENHRVLRYKNITVLYVFNKSKDICVIAAYYCSIFMADEEIDWSALRKKSLVGLYVPRATICPVCTVFLHKNMQDD